jgi:hypothetical protein
MTGKKRKYSEEDKKNAAYFSNCLLAQSLLFEATLCFLKYLGNHPRTDALYVKLSASQETLERMHADIEAITKKILGKGFPSEEERRIKLRRRADNLLHRMQKW